MDKSAQKSLKLLGSLVDQRTVIFGSGAGPKFISVYNIRYEFLVTKVLPSIPIPPMDSVTQTGSPLNNSLYSGVRKKRIKRNFITK